eukprot:4419188-Ditylum_brightwellii.AAC.1
MKGYEYPRHPLASRNKEVGSYTKALGQRFRGGPDTNPAATSQLNKAVARPRKRQIVHLDIGV